MTAEEYYARVRLYVIMQVSSAVKQYMQVDEESPKYGIVYRHIEQREHNTKWYWQIAHIDQQKLTEKRGDGKQSTITS